MRPEARTRFAPSPTGLLHVGSVRTALFNYLFAKKNGGKFILRIEDTDRIRSKREFENGIMEDLRWLGLRWDEGPDAGGEKGPYRQSERIGIYTDTAGRLLENGLAYRCYCTQERLDALKREQLKAGSPPRYDGKCRTLSEKDVPAGVTPSIRFRVPEKRITFDDGVHGTLSFDSRLFGDFVIIGSDGIAAYNFAVVADDALMGITDIIRGDDHVSNTPRQILLFEAMGLRPPAFTHIPLVLDRDGAPLGKRHASASIKGLREEGFLPGAILNAIARLGWNPGEGRLGLDEMTGLFSVKRLSKSPSAFDMERLKAFNKEELARTDGAALLELAGLPVERGLLDAASAVKRNAITMKDFKTLITPFAGDVEISGDIRSMLMEPYARKVLDALRDSVFKAGLLDEMNYNEIIESVKQATGEKGKRLYLPVRGALTGQTEGIELAAILKLLGRDRVLKRISAFLA